MTGVYLRIKMAAAPSEGLTNPEAIYYDVDPKQVFAVRLFGAVTGVNILLAVIFVLVKAHENPHFYLLVVNLALSTLIAILLAWWYRRGQLSADKHWYMALVCAVILLQAITADLYVFNHVVVASKHSVFPATNVSTSTAPTIKPPG
ncbi:PREDICTED: uncharacterized protein LOC109466750 [Branchiostoma belcheri]|uniref:Uncharacterized protein LOC109466750 n=1 Tax=Branchiostoma belcheri TaxID=7741 RepID=A0A6P4YS51_BRABE|nr:PREDICTED: uncharacterized protein LOC109466750 [Branchiostoma belcheri]